MTVRVRLAPSPTGTLHIGTARTALFNWLFAKKEGGKFLIRIEDTDKERSKIQYTENILEGLKWLGLNWDETPIIQSESLEKHKSAIKKLLNNGHAYRCYVTEEELCAMRDLQLKEGKAPRYDNRHRNLTKEEEEEFIREGRSSVIRFKIDSERSIKWKDLIRGDMKWQGSDLGGDMVVSRRTSSQDIGDPLYNLVVVLDDSSMNITHVIRGEDHIANTAKQILIYEALGLDKPLFAHTPLILSQSGKKLSKRDGVTSIDDFKQIGYTPEALANYMTLLGWSVPEGMDEKFTILEASTVFELDKVNKSGAKFDWDKLNWLNAEVIHNLSSDKLLEALEPLWEKEGWDISTKTIEWKVSLADLIKTSLTVLKDGIIESKAFYEEPKIDLESRNQLDLPGAKEAIDCLIDELKKTPWDGKNIEEGKNLLMKVAESSKVKKGLVMKSVRAALLGQMHGPDLMNSWSLLARINKDIQRLENSIQLFI